MHTRRNLHDHLSYCLGEVIALRRRRLKMSQEELAEKAGVDRAFISSIERNKRNPSFRTIAYVAHGLRMKFARLVDNCERRAAHHANKFV